MTSEWITRLADDQRRRDAVRAGEVEAAARKSEFARRHGRGLVDELRATVSTDVDAFRQEFPGDQARDVTVDFEAEGEFTVRKPGHPPVSLSVAPRQDAVVCVYSFASDNGMPAREDRFELLFAPYGDDAARFKHSGSGQVFPTAEALAEYLLTPVFTGHPR